MKQVIQSDIPWPVLPADAPKWANDLISTLGYAFRMLAVREDKTVHEGTESEMPTPDGTKRFYYADDKGTLLYDKGSWIGIVPETRILGADGYETISAAITTIGSDYVRLVLPPRSITLAANLTLPGNITLVVPPLSSGAVLNVSDGYTLTIKGPIEAGPYRIFGWTSTGAFNISESPSVRCYLPWWGAVKGTSNDCTAAINKAVASTGYHQQIWVPEGQWRITSNVAIDKSPGIRLFGEGKARSAIYIDVGTSADGLTFGVYGSSNYHTELRDIAFVGPANACKCGLKFIWEQFLTLDQVVFAMGATEYALWIQGCTHLDANVDVTYSAITFGGSVPANGIRILRDPGAIPYACNIGRMYAKVNMYGASAPYCFNIGNTGTYVDQVGSNFILSGVAESYGASGIPLHAENWNSGLLDRFHIEGTGSSYLKKCQNLRINEYHGYGTDQTLDIQGCDNIRIDDSDMAILKIDSATRGCVLGALMIVNANGIQDSAPDTIYEGPVVRNIGVSPRTPYDLYGQRADNLLENTFFNRFQSDRPERWTNYSTWTQCGVGLGDTTRHEAQFCAKSYVSASQTEYYQLNAEELRYVLGKYVNYTIWIKVPDESQTYATWPFIMIATSGGATNPTYSSNTMTPLTVADLGTWRKVVCAGYIPADCTAVYLRFYHYIKTGGGASTAYIAEPCLKIGRHASRGILPGRDEHESNMFLNGIRITTATAKPTTGFYRAGDIVINSAPSKDGNNMTLFGWSRLTTGYGHTSGTDWAIMYISHVSPAT